MLWISLCFVSFTPLPICFFGFFVIYDNSNKCYGGGSSSCWVSLVFLRISLRYSGFFFIFLPHHSFPCRLKLKLFKSWVHSRRVPRILPHGVDLQFRKQQSNIQQPRQSHRIAHLETQQQPQSITLNITKPLTLTLIIDLHPESESDHNPHPTPNSKP